MGFRIEDNCVGPCPMGCIHCGRSREHNYFCDECDEEYLEELFEYDGKELCGECYKSKFNQKICDDMDDTLCAECGKEAEVLYQIEGNEWVCESCLMDMAEKIHD